MSNADRQLVSQFILECLREHSDEQDLDDQDSLFLSGRLDSLSVTKLVVFLEQTFGVDFADHPFDVAELDSVVQIVEFTEQHRAA